MNFFFVYDTAFCKSDEDDPKDAVVLFFPAQASESQGHFLCCQLAGVAKFLKTTFSAPSVIGLDHGKFAFIWSGNYLLGLGAGSDVDTSALKDQLLFLCGIFCFYHGSMGNVLKECKDNRHDFLLKLELSWSRYVTLTQGFGNVLQLSLQSLPLKTAEKGRSAVASRLLHLCQLSPGVISGAVFYNSRVLASQFLPQVTNYLSLLSNSNASAPVTNVQPRPASLPPDVELKWVYLSRTRRTGRGRTYSAPVAGSGSEGDVDSGNCSGRSRGDDNHSKWRQCASGLHCCGFHARLFEKRTSASRNVCFRKENRRRSFSGIRTSKRGSAAAAASVPCHARSGTLRHSEGTCSADAEFRCRRSARVGAISLKRWNSDPEMSAHWRSVSCEPCVSDCSHKVRSRRSRRQSTDPRSRAKLEPCVDVGENDLVRQVLYVQRYGGSTLVLLLRKHHDEKAINYLWNCGFSVLRELEVECGDRNESPYSFEPSFYVLRYNHAQRTLKEYPSFLITEKHSRQTIQKIREEFKMDAKFVSICLLSSHCSIFASHHDPNLSFYLQPESNTRKLDPLVHLQAKATRRLAKYFKV